MVGVLKVEVVGLDKLEFVNNGIKQNLTNTLQLYNANNTLHLTPAKFSTNSSSV